MSWKFDAPRCEADPAVLRSTASSIEPLFPDAANLLRGMAGNVAPSVVDPSCTACDCGYPASACSTNCKCGAC